MTEETKQMIRGLSTTEKIANELIAKVEKEESEKTRCEYPMSDFYTYQEDVPLNSRVSIPEDCESCKENCVDKHCLITENEGEETEKEKNCESKCPYCGSYDVDWGLKFSVSDEYYHQRATCLNCDHCFTEVSEIVYKSTIVDGE